MKAKMDNDFLYFLHTATNQSQSEQSICDNENWEELKSVGLFSQVNK